MACMSCRKKAEALITNNKLANAESKGVENSVYQALYDTGEFEFVRYMGASYSHLVAPITDAIVKFNLSNYGQARKGAILLVHKDDIKAKPNIFVKLKKDSPVLKTQLRRIGRDKVEPEKQTKTTKKTVEVEEPVVEAQATVDTPDLKDEPKELVTESNSLVDIKKSEALTLDEYAEKFGYTHRLQVLGLVKSNQLKSFKNEKDDKTYVYTVED